MFQPLCNDSARQPGFGSSRSRRSRSRSQAASLSVAKTGARRRAPIRASRKPDEPRRARRVRPKPPRPRESLSDGLREFEAAVEEEDCPRIRSLGFNGKAQITAERCEKRFLPSLEGFRPEDREQYRSVGVVDFRTKLGSETLVFLLAKDGRFRWALRAPRPQRKEAVGTEPPPRRRLDGVASSAVKAFRSGPCEPLRKDGKGVLLDPDLARQQCQRATWLRKPLRGDPSARPKRLGASSSVAF